jgi:uncharacterized protein YutE (UPF0331/DUF86 family)
VRRHRLGLPQESREAFDLLVQADRLDADLADRLKRMVGFRNVAVHDYTQINLDIVRAIVEGRMNDLTSFSEGVLRAAD